MTVEELINKLREMDPTSEVLIEDHEYGPTTIDSVLTESPLTEHFSSLEKSKIVWLTFGSVKTN